MASEQCLANIKAKGGVFCQDNSCAELQPEINTYCQNHNMGPSEPYPTRDSSGNKCYCCCSCFAYGTPIEVEQGLYRLIESIGVGEKVLATGPAVGGWQQAEVTLVGGIAAEVEVDFMLLGQFRLSGGELRFLVASADHLFLNAAPVGGVLVPFADLRPGHVVRTADGGEATVVLTSFIQYSGGVRHIGLGPWEPDQPLDGHLLNSNGLVTADLSVQLAHFAGALPESLLDRDFDPPPIGSAEFHAAYDTTAYTAFVNDPSKWPAGCRPLSPGLMNIPLSALAYFTPEQAEDIERSLGPQNLGNSMRLTQALYLFDVFGAFYKDIAFIVDWANTTPNAWFFMDYRQRYAVVSGGLLRVPELMLSGLSFVAAHLVANSRGIGCTAEADWEGTRSELREVWYDELFFETVDTGIPELEKLFERIDPAHRDGDPDNRCVAPAISCRLDAIAAGVRGSKLPECAKPLPDFAVSGAEARGLNEVRVSFSRAVNPPSASNPASYTFEPAATTLAVHLDPAEADTVVLTVDELRMGAEYVVTVRNVFSFDGRPIVPGHSTARFGVGEAS